ncbi:MAG: RlmE family RNA methyltransferase [Gammaproteobacteria bacterium]|nr:RlmE family RNA methyltransferase [Gammaproteobacteria bacterium]NNF67159.1 RlmE family RNA methyltransferase [Gammaproteobacteria bacterium]
MSRRSKSNRWRTAQEKDTYVRRARTEGWRSRAVFKLEEIDKKHNLIRPGMTVVDLGAAPGGWSQYAAYRLKGSGLLVALDLLPMDRLPDVEFIQGDFEDDTVVNQLMNILEKRPVDLVMSDMAPNISGMRVVDQPRSMALAEVARELAFDVLAPGGTFIAKLFHGEGFDEFVRESRAHFRSVAVKKPAASRPSSRETYLVARNYRV